MKINFSYDLDKDVENFLKTLSSENNRERTEFHGLYVKEYGQDFDPDQVRKFIQEHVKDIDIESVLAEIKNNWLPIQDQFIERIEKLFGIKYPYEKINVYLTTNNLCSYNTKESYFFVHATGGYQNATIMHELLHFYTWHAFYEELMSKGVSREKYNDIKESLTELLNIEFADLMAGAVDRGYPQHQEMRAKICEMWASEKDLNSIVSKLTK